MESLTSISFSAKTREQAMAKMHNLVHIWKGKHSKNSKKQWAKWKYGVQFQRRTHTTIQAVLSVMQLTMSLD